MDELREALPALGFGRVRAELWRMARIGSVTRYEDGRYGITPDCVIPAGMTMREVLAAAGVAA